MPNNRVVKGGPAPLWPSNRARVIVGAVAFVVIAILVIVLV